MFKILLIVTTCFMLQTSIYSLHFNTSTGTDTSMSAYEGRKILLVNIATASPRASQLAGLQQLQQQYGDSLTVIAFPSNSFGNEPRSNSAIRQYCDSAYGAGFQIAEKGNVTGAQQTAIYQWLTSRTVNGVTGAAIIGDFQKYLIGKDGSIIGVFSPVVTPTDSLITKAITNAN